MKQVGSTKNVCIAGSRALPIDGDLIQILLDEITSLNGRGFEMILLRKPLYGEVRLFESVVTALARAFSLSVTYYEPEPGGRAMIFYRDIDMVEDAQEIVAFFPEDGEMLGGTGHVVDTAINQSKPVRAYAVVNGSLVLIGSDNEETPSQSA